MKLVAYCIGLSDAEIKTIRDIKSEASIRVVSQNGLTSIIARGVYNDLLEVVVAITKFRTFEIHLS